MVKGGFYLYRGDKYVGPVEDVMGVYEGWRRGRDLNPRGVFPHRLSRAKSSEEVTPNDRFINPATPTHYYWGCYGNSHAQRTPY